jgi:hypothetical protein
MLYARLWLGPCMQSQVCDGCTGLITGPAAWPTPKQNQTSLLRAEGLNCIVIPNRKLFWPWQRWTSRANWFRSKCFHTHFVESKGFWRWCMAQSITGFLDFVQRPEFYIIENTTFLKLETLCWVPYKELTITSNCTTVPLCACSTTIVCCICSYYIFWTMPGVSAFMADIIWQGSPVTEVSTF